VSTLGRPAAPRAGQFPRNVLLRARWLLPVSGAPIEDAWIEIRHGRICGVGRGKHPCGLGATLDLGDAIVTSGFINAHTHLEFSECLQPFDASGGLPQWIDRVVRWRRETATAAAASSSLTPLLAGLHESAAAGVVAVGDIATAVPSAADLPLLLHGPRLRVFRELLGLTPPPPGTASPAALTVFRDAQRLSRAGIAVGLSPHAPYSTQWPLGRWAVAAARRLHRQLPATRRASIPLAMHLAESADEDQFLHSQTGPFRTLFESLGVWPARPPRLASTADWISLLARADRGLIIHGTYLPADAQALARLRRHRSRLAVAFCPRTTLALAGRLPPVDAFQRAGIRICLGTDGRGSNPDLSIRHEAATLIAAGLVTPTEALRMITLNAAWALGFEHCTGHVAAGRPADLVILRPAGTARDAAAATAAVFAPDTTVLATLRGGRLIAGQLDFSGA
jgi:cytosine/adenosine deaminase-related metal-dependent hydrolase